MELLPSSRLSCPVLLNDAPVSMVGHLIHKESSPELAWILIQDSKANWTLRSSNHYGYPL